ncbi:MAG TPA: cellulase family glycosylhydrolase [Ktedonobacterales bacterium]|nr:cellulase family glycosylhydrolase [Ktedonobacterales bacterium]
MRNKHIGTFPRQVVMNVIVALVAVAAIIGGLTHAVLNLSVQSAVQAHTSVAASPTPVPTRDPWTTEALSVNGLQIVNTQGQPVTLLGASRFSLEYECHGDGHFQTSDFQAMRSWGMNTVRIPLSSTFWRDLGNQCPDYQATVASAVASAEAAGLYVILDLQRDAPLSLPQDGARGGAQCPLPDAKYDVSFWQDLAEIYQNDPRVLFDLFGEPYNIDWSQWWHGGSVTSDCFAYQHAYTYTAIGMPALAADVRAIAPRNIIILSGAGWGYDLSGINRQNAVQVSNVLYATHPWDHQSAQQPGDWPRAFGATARQLPVIATEFGAYDCRTGYISTEITYFERLHMSFLAWAWAPGACTTPGLLANWSGAPTASYGEFIKTQMLQAAKANPAPQP